MYDFPAGLLNKVFHQCFDSYDLSKLGNDEEPTFREQIDVIDVKNYDQFLSTDLKLWEEVNERYSVLMKSAQRAFGANLTINKVLVGIGIGLIFNALVYSWINGTDLFSLITGGAGATFIGIFFLLPQKMINKAIGNLAQIHLIYKTHAASWEYLKMYGREKIISIKKRGQPMDENEAKQILNLWKDFGDTTENYVKMIQHYVENEKEEPTEQPNKPKPNDNTSRTTPV